MSSGVKRRMAAQKAGGGHFQMAQCAKLERSRYGKPTYCINGRCEVIFPEMLGGAQIFPFFIQKH